MPTDDTRSSTSVMDKLVPVALSKLDAFPKVPTAYRARSESRGLMTLFITFVGILLVLNDVGEYIWGWPHYSFKVDDNKDNYLSVNLDMVVAMPCGFLSVDLRDAMGDRLFLSSSLRRDGVRFDVGQATALKEHTDALSVAQTVAQSRKSRGFLSWLPGRTTKPAYRPTYKHESDGSACRIFGSLAVKRVMANLHITTLGHGYNSYEHVDHQKMNLSHVISEFSFGPHFPEIVQPLDNSYESTDEHFISYQYFLHIVPTTYIAPRRYPLNTHQYSVTHYTRTVEHDRGTPGIFFKFELDPLHITIHQRTLTLVQLLTRCVGVLGGAFVCMGYAIRITTRAVEVVSGSDQQAGIVAADATGVKLGLRAKWGGGELRSRGKLVPQGSGWTVEGGSAVGSPVGVGSPYTSYAGTPVIPAFTPSAGGPVPSPYLNSPSMLNQQQSLPGSPLPPPSPYATHHHIPPPSARSVSGSHLGPPRTPGYPPPPSSPYGSAHASPSIPSAQVDSSAYGNGSNGNGTPVSAYGTYTNGSNGSNGNVYHPPHTPRSPNLAGGKKDD